MNQNQENSFSNRVLVLGSQGFVGKNLSTYLPKNSLLLSSKDLDLLSSDASNKLSKLIQPTDTVVFISALTPDKGRGSDTLVKNIIMAQTVIDALSTSVCKHLIYISSDAVYDDSLSLVRENSSCDPQSFHGCMHIVREKMLLDLETKKKIPLLRLRPCAIYGAGDTHNSYGPNRFIRTLKEQKPIQLGGEGEEQRDHIFIDDFCKLIVRCINEETVGVFNVASGKAVSFYEVAKIVAEIFKAKDVIKFSDRSAPITHKHFDMTLLNSAFPGFVFTPLRDGLVLSSDL
jgi:UDP-glucose 4-epimerase